MALAVQTTGSVSTTGATSITISSFAVSGLNRSIVVTTNADSNVTVSSVVFNGSESFTLVKYQDDAADGRAAEMWKLTAPTATTADIVITFSGSTQAEAGAIQFTGATGDVTDPQGTETPSGTTYSLTIATTSGDIVVASITTGNRTVTETGGSTEVYDINPVDQRGETHYITATGATQVMTATISSAAASAFIAANVVAGTQPVVSSNPRVLMF